MKHTFKEFLDEQTMIMESADFADLRKMIADDVYDSIESLAKKVKSWAVTNMTSATKMGKPTDLYKKIINNPEKVTQQLVKAIIDRLKDDGVPLLVNEK